MSLVALLVVLIVFGVFLWWIGSLPIDSKIKYLITAVVVLVLIVFVLHAFGVWEQIISVKVPKV